MSNQHDFLKGLFTLSNLLLEYEGRTFHVFKFLEFTCELIYHIKKRKVASNQNPLLLSGKAVKRDLNIFPYMF